MKKIRFITSESVRRSASPAQMRGKKAFRRFLCPFEGSFLLKMMILREYDSKFTRF